MEIQVVSKYLSLSEEGLLDKINCPIDKGLLLPNMDEEEKIYLYCLSCDYKNFIGTNLYNKLKSKVESVKGK